MFASQTRLIAPSLPDRLERRGRRRREGVRRRHAGRRRRLALDRLRAEQRDRAHHVAPRLAELHPRVHERRRRHRLVVDRRRHRSAGAGGDGTPAASTGRTPVPRQAGGLSYGRRNLVDVEGARDRQACRSAWTSAGLPAPRARRRRASASAGGVPGHRERRLGVRARRAPTAPTAARHQQAPAGGRTRSPSAPCG